MNDVDKIFSKLDKAEVKSPDVWNSIESKLNNNIESSKGFSKRTKTIILSSILAAAVCVGSYLYITPEKEDVSIPLNTIAETKIEQEAMATASDFQTTKEEIAIIEQEPNVQKVVIKEENYNTEYDIREQEPQIENTTSQSLKPFEINNNIVPVSPIKIEQKPEQETKIIKEDVLEQEEHAIEQTVNNHSASSLRFSSIITPNYDGINDVFLVKNIEDYPDNSLTIFDPNGKVVFNQNNYQNDFSAQNIADGVYYYRFIYSDLGVRCEKIGALEIRRK